MSTPNSLIRLDRLPQETRVLAIDENTISFSLCSDDLNQLVGFCAEDTLTFRAHHHVSITFKPAGKKTTESANKTASIGKSQNIEVAIRDNWSLATSGLLYVQPNDDVSDLVLIKKSDRKLVVPFDGAGLGDLLSAAQGSKMSATYDIPVLRRLSGEPLSTLSGFKIPKVGTVVQLEFLGRRDKGQPVSFAL